MTDRAGLGALIDRRSVVICCGPGGVGKTTVAAGIAVDAARRGRRAVVMTIDPARRLADALGLAALPSEPHPVEGDWSGELSALMLDARATFDNLVRQHAPSPDQAEQILANRFYRNIAGALSGTQEYMAMEKLYELHHDPRFDLVVVDTPPTRNALDFVDAPRRLTRFLDNRIFRLLMLPTRASVRALGMATQAVTRAVSRVVGTDVVAEAVAFFQAFEGMEDGFRRRAQRVLELLPADDTAFVLVTSARRDAIEEAGYFAAKLAESGIAVRGLVLNRLHPRFAPPGSRAELVERVGRLEAPALGRALANLVGLEALADAEEEQAAGLIAAVHPAAVVRVPLMADDVHDLDGLEAVSRYVFAV